jgi:hypothetical protein
MLLEQRNQGCQFIKLAAVTKSIYGRLRVHTVKTNVRTLWTRVFSRFILSSESLTQLQNASHMHRFLRSTYGAIFHTIVVVGMLYAQVAQP